jgi:hypothetical protein
MKKIEVVNLLENMALIYPTKFEANEKAVNAFHFHLEDQDYHVVMRNFKQYAKENKFPPTISDLVERKRLPYELDNPLTKLDQWEGAASGNLKR